MFSFSKSIKWTFPCIRYRQVSVIKRTDVITKNLLVRHAWKICIHSPEQVIFGYVNLRQFELHHVLLSQTITGGVNVTPSLNCIYTIRQIQIWWKLYHRSAKRPECPFLYRNRILCQKAAPAWWQKFYFYFHFRHQYMSSLYSGFQSSVSHNQRMRFLYTAWISCQRDHSSRDIPIQHLLGIFRTHSLASFCPVKWTHGLIKCVRVFLNGIFTTQDNHLLSLLSLFVLYFHLKIFPPIRSQNNPWKIDKLNTNAEEKSSFRSVHKTVVFRKKNNNKIMRRSWIRSRRSRPVCKRDIGDRFV